MPGEVALAAITAAPVRVEDCTAAVTAAHCGAVVGFAGVVRDHDGGRAVMALSYTAHPTAVDVLRAVAEDVAAAHPGVRVAVAHRVGDLVVGEVALAAAVAAAHRAEAFAACSRLVDEVKARVPIWKEQRFADGGTEWVGALD